MAYCKKYKALILKYMACIFRLVKPLMHSNLHPRFKTRINA